MSISDILTKHADTFRQKTGVTNKLSIPEMTNLMASLKWGQSNLLKGTSNQYREVNTNTTDHDDWVQLTMTNGSSNQKVIHDLLTANDNDFESYRRKEYTDSVVNMLDSLSIDELGSMAETLVSLTSFKRKFSGEMQTVGGPIDVLTISRGEGPIWMKRKQFFDFNQNKGYELRRK